MRRFITLLLIAAVCCTSIGCTSKNNEPPLDRSSAVSGMDITSSSDRSTTVLPDSYFIETENYFDYQPGLECSAFSSAFVLRHYGKEADGLTLFETFPGKLSFGGVSPPGIITFFTELGYTAKFNENGTVDTIKAELFKGAPIIVMIHVAEPYDSPHNTHYVPIVGYDTENFYFAESLADYANCSDEMDVPYNRKTAFDKFERLWTNIDTYWENPYFTITPKD